MKKHMLCVGRVGPGDWQIAAPPRAVTLRSTKSGVTRAVMVTLETNYGWFGWACGNTPMGGHFWTRNNWEAVTN